MNKLIKKYNEISENIKEKNNDREHYREEVKYKQSETKILLVFILNNLIGLILSNIYSYLIFTDFGTHKFTILAMMIVNVFVLYFKKSKRESFLFKMFDKRFGLKTSDKIKKETGTLFIPVSLILVFLPFTSLLFLAAAIFTVFATFLPMLMVYVLKKILKPSTSKRLVLDERVKVRALNKEINKLNKEKNLLYEKIKKDSKTMHYLKGLSKEKATESESLLLEQIIYDLEKKYRDRLFEEHLNERKKYEVENI
jgi:hypothetical protein